MIRRIYRIERTRSRREFLDIGDRNPNLIGLIERSLPESLGRMMQTSFKAMCIDQGISVSARRAVEV